LGTIELVEDLLGAVTPDDDEMVEEQAPLLAEDAARARVVDEQTGEGERATRGGDFHAPGRPLVCRRLGRTHVVLHVAAVLQAEAGAQADPAWMRGVDLHLQRRSVLGERIA